jgi:hypothetical protein
MFHPPPPTTSVFGKRLNQDYVTNQEPPQKKYKPEYVGVYYTDYFSPFFVRIEKIGSAIVFSNGN